MEQTKKDWAIITLVLFSVLSFSCKSEPTYEQVVEKELKKGIKNDSLFHGLYFGMSMSDFFDYSFEMNQKGIFFQNNFNVEVIVHYDTEFGDPVDFVFFPDESFPSIQRIEGYMKFRKWSPFTKDFTAKRLQEQFKEKFVEWYDGRDFIRVPHPKGYWPSAYAKIDGNRKILLYRSFDDQRVEIVFENLNYTN